MRMREEEKVKSAFQGAQGLFRRIQFSPSKVVKYRQRVCQKLDWIRGKQRCLHMYYINSTEVCHSESQCVSQRCSRNKLS